MFRRVLLPVLFGVASACSCQGPSPEDAGVPDAGREDAGAPDAGPVDAGEVDAGAPDAGAPDAGRRDAGTLPDAGTLRCLGVACVGDTTCSTEDGECRCNGAICTSGQTCECPQAMPGCAPSERICVTSTRCDGRTCMNGTSCDLADGLCKCPGPAGPVCGEMQFCGAAFPPQCSGGTCTQLCEGGQSCDPDDDTCKCGGRGGLPCAAGELCISSPGQYACRLACAAFGGACPTDQACFIDTRALRGAAYCAFPSGLLAEGEECIRPTQCFDGHPLHCVGLTNTVPVGRCREACDPNTLQCPAGRRCVVTAAVRDAGFCVP